MKKRSTDDAKPAGRKPYAVTAVHGRFVTRSGRTGYEVSSATGERRNLIVPSKSEAAARKAVERFGPALRRLADR
jgi:hypothetical protein